MAGNGLDVVKAKELLRKHVEAYDEWAAEIDRSVKWAAVFLGPMSSIQQPIEETEAPPLSECIDPSLYEGIPTAKELYQILQDKPQLYDYIISVGFLSVGPSLFFIFFALIITVISCT